MASASSSRRLLVELFVEELPPRALRMLGSEFAQLVFNGLVRHQLTAAESPFRSFATPRRLGVLIEAVLPRSADRTEAEKLMPASVGLTADGQATPALVKRLATLGADASVVPGLERRTDGKAVNLYFQRTVPGAALAEALQAVLLDAVAKLPVPKRMQYQLADGWTSVSFVRPAHGLVALHGGEVVPVRVLGLDAGRSTFGHRFEAAVAPIELRSAQSYEQQLRDEGAVIAAFEARRESIVQQLTAAAGAVGLRPIEDEELLKEVTALVERPNVLACAFEPEFLAVPSECLVLTMKANQKYFPLLDASGTLTNRFLVVSNIAPADPRRVVEGNERVVRPRLADAKFFFDQDRKRSLESRVPALDKVVYHGRLGSQGDRVRRLRRIARWVAAQIGADVAAAERAALLAKADLLTDMVGEFPELQGIMGGYYAAHDGEPADVVEAIRGQYANQRSDGRGAATNLVAEALLIADRAETLVGIWGIGLKPTGEKDPFALRRHALTLIQAFERVSAASGRASLDLRELLGEAARSFDLPLDPRVVDELEDFIFERRFHQLSSLFDTRVVDAVISPRPPLHETLDRVHAVRDFLKLPEAPALAAANKRVGNILRKSGDGIADGVDAALFSEPAEIELAEALRALGGRADAAFRAGRYDESLRLLAGLKLPVDAFFDKVMVNVEAPDVRANRLALLSMLRTTMNRVADLSRLAQ
ncbi:MAG TPA: glycine--tRNA ligase subunit beta [Caldimonas sp.]|jgi:glycyl-tRNA synthetase beta chain|nr:glycine--tRNA ligase subunit beta [Caldimonas sp.]HEX2542346.1 glycine--tRNA ligase subunit beta [Caldimonas sp.]